MISADDYLFCSRYQTKLKTSWGFLRSNLAKAFWVIRLQLEVTNYIILLDIFLFYVDTDYLYLALSVRWWVSWSVSLSGRWSVSLSVGLVQGPT